MTSSTQPFQSTGIRTYWIAILALLCVVAMVTILGISRFRSATPLPTADSILVIKHDHTLTLLRDGQPIGNTASHSDVEASSHGSSTRRVVELR